MTCDRQHYVSTVRNAVQISQYCAVPLQQQQHLRRARRNGSRNRIPCLLEACQRHRCKLCTHEIRTYNNIIVSVATAAVNRAGVFFFYLPRSATDNNIIMSSRHTHTLIYSNRDYYLTNFFFSPPQLWPSRRKRTTFANLFIIVPASQRGDTIYMKFLDTGKFAPRPCRRRFES